MRRLNLLVTGGSQGARVMADVVPAAIALLGPDERQWIRLTQQARGEDSARVAAATSACRIRLSPTRIARMPAAPSCATSRGCSIRVLWRNSRQRSRR